MTPTEHLTAAAERLRELAGAATPGPWVVEPFGTVVSTAILPPGAHDGVAYDMSEGDPAYIAAMSPPVALALADWFDAEAEHVASYDCMAHCEPAGCDRGHKALALAALIVPTEETA